MVGFDFNPTVDRIRLITSTGQNLRLNPETGTVASTDGAISGVAGASITAVAYTNNVAGATTTELYAINSASRQLYLISQPNEGTVAPIGGLNLSIIGDGGFDIHGKSGTALGLYAVSGTPTLFAVDLATGAAKSLAQYDVSLDYSSIAIPTSPVAYAVTINNDLLIVDPTNPSTSITKPITGLTPNEEMAGLDFRPLNGQLYALTVQRPQGGPQMDNGRLYTINAATAEATRVASLSVPLTFRGAYGFDFNPVVDRIRIVSRSGLNVRVNPADGSAIQDGDLNPGTPVVEAAAYDNNFAGATISNLYVIDTRDFSPRAPFLSAKLFQLNAPNAGNMVEVGNLELNAGPGSNFDIGGTTNTGYAVLNITGSTELYTIDLATGKATSKGIFGRSSGGIGTSGFTVGLGF
ncbi:hypothetical protein GCM10011375_12700 [Hymenobacter qilianensis]|uniref:DUF4394 domain-containing protein n=2 Tax=Hymenobacter qilianensis TaxID=1385715 RepID=A0A7H0GY17_9BACT|nr:DUF4394 domain-containing protein [Hymenobacter qilianensis]GGF58983.1 hypothetical protein GCM10011375_12700 [Hymenobacter qilianensis]